MQWPQGHANIPIARWNSERANEQWKKDQSIRHCTTKILMRSDTMIYRIKS